VIYSYVNNKKRFDPYDPKNYTKCRSCRPLCVPLDGEFAMHDIRNKPFNYISAINRDKELLESLKRLLSCKYIKSTTVTSDMLITPDVRIPYNSSFLATADFFKKSYIIDRAGDLNMEIKLGDIVFTYEFDDGVHIVAITDMQLLKKLVDKIPFINAYQSNRIQRDCRSDQE